MSIACTDYRMEMMLAGLRRRVQNPELSESERQELQKEIARLEVSLGLCDEPASEPGN